MYRFSLLSMSELERILDMHFILYKDTQSQWRWRLRRDGNYSILADSAESYWNRQDCLNAIGRIA
jgi:uncharacterized protein YegP (UPF0339 family)